MEARAKTAESMLLLQEEKLEQVVKVFAEVNLPHASH